MIKNYLELCKKLKLNLKKECTLTFIIFLTIVLIGFVLMFIDSFISGFLMIMCSFLYFYSHYSSLKNSYNQLVISKEIAFNGFYRYVVTLLKNNHILYSALKASLEYSDEVLLDDINELIEDIENDTTIEPFLKFMNNFNDESIKQMIMLLYKTQEVGVANEVLNSINECMVYLQDTSIKSYTSIESKKVERYYIYPIVLSTAVVLLITSYVFSLLGSSMYV